MSTLTSSDTRPRSATASERLALGRLWWAAPLAAAAAALANAVVYSLAKSAGALPDSVLVPGPAGLQPLGLGTVLVTSAGAAIGAAAVLALFGRLARWPLRTFRLVAAVVLVLSLATPLTIPGPPPAMVLALALMHILAAAVIMGILTTLTQGR